jgi:C-terminal processing protease CtpA/Prc
VIVDVRLNPGGDNTAYRPLLDLLRGRLVNRPGRLVLLTGRVTFSAAGNFAAEVDARTRARIVGEAAGGSPHNYGDMTEVELETLGWTVHVPPQYVEVLGRPDERAALEPDVPLQIGAADHFAGRDPVLARAIALP